MTTDNTANPGPESTSCDLEDLTAKPALRQLSDYTDAELLKALDDASQHISGKAWTVTALAQESIRRANEKDGSAA